ncbi:NAD(P)H-hydrate dehydratase [Leadbettera azotonutricia]|uniref:ADP-dependent (S)-NAD(P)H-hydrate dehydratase n=1 Tax=Leadbettera azotonutricia (strain ATCC BAA-888 / DSM 13862 / ZAS-9) TaxID=545695 RepID=F5YAY5_LEAAZ|nr:NAD(P)H-hydrate dehydratase [Leadbettera azotonutricia]AEF82245.1 carbohydrate kinase family protein [Leadbettera azotonutricia ZAS-9]
MQKLLVSSDTARKIDEEAQSAWGFNTFALVESAGRSCARVFVKAFPKFFDSRIPSIAIAAGSGSNAADAMVMLRYWILQGLASPSSSTVVVAKPPKRDEKNPYSEVFLSLKKMEVPILVWDGDLGEAAGRQSEDALARADIIIDGIFGTGVKGPVKGSSEEMITVVNALKRGTRAYATDQYKKPFVVSIDVPSGNSDEWKPGMPIMEADVTLSIEPQKICLFNPAARAFAGEIISLGDVFPPGLINSHQGAELLDWARARNFLPRIRPDAYKHERGTLEIRAGSVGTTGAALIAARGAQAAGAGLVRILADDDIYPILASRASGVMVSPISREGKGDRFKPDALLLGPGWGKEGDRAEQLAQALEKEKNGTPVILDADAIALARDAVFHKNAILTPHFGEFAAYVGLEIDKALNNPSKMLLEIAKEKKATIILKGHIITIAGADGRWGVIDGMMPALAAGGSGDLLAGFCGAMAARMARKGAFDGYACAAAAVSLLIAAGRLVGPRFIDPLELADKAADLAGQAWLCTGDN